MCIYANMILKWSLRKYSVNVLKPEWSGGCVDRGTEDMPFNSRLKQFRDHGSRVLMALRTWLFSRYAFAVVLCRFISEFGRSFIQGVLKCVIRVSLNMKVPVDHYTIHQTSRPSGKHSCFAFGRFQIQISTRRRTITSGFSCFPQSFQANAVMMPQITFVPLPLIHYWLSCHSTLNMQAGETASLNISQWLVTWHHTGMRYRNIGNKIRTCVTITKTRLRVLIMKKLYSMSGVLNIKMFSQCQSLLHGRKCPAFLPAADTESPHQLNRHVEHYSICSDTRRIVHYDETKLPIFRCVTWQKFITFRGFDFF